MILGHVPVTWTPGAFAGERTSNLEVASRPVWSDEILPRRARYPAQQAELLATRTIVPHRDPTYRGKVFLTLTVLGEWAHVGDARVRRRSEEMPWAVDPMLVDYPVPPGTLFAVQPTVVHWLHARRVAGQPDHRAKWVGLQWVVPTALAPAAARMLIQDLGGTWSSELEPRYEYWKPT